MDLQKKLQEAVDAMLNKLERDRIRPIQRNSHLKIAECYANKSASAEEVEACANHCSLPIQKVQMIIQNEMNVFQNRVNRCAEQCSDEVNDKFSSVADSPANQQAAQKMMHDCAQSCVDKHVALLKSVQAKLEKDLDQLK